MASLGGPEDQCLVGAGNSKAKPHSLTLLMQVVYSLVQGQPLCSHSVGTGKSGAGLVITFITADTLMCGGKVRHTRKYLV